MGTYDILFELLLIISGLRLLWYVIAEGRKGVDLLVAICFGVAGIAFLIYGENLSSTRHKLGKPIPFEELSKISSSTNHKK